MNKFKLFTFENKIKGNNGLYYTSSNIDYNMNSMYYNNASKTPISSIVTFTIKN